MDGLLITDKPEGPTSAEVVRIVKRQLRRKIGHLGTLDPFASGVLPLCIGDGTKIAQFLNTADKEYEGTIVLGSATETGDPTGRVCRTEPVPSLPDAQLAELARRFCGERWQTPPMYSAVKQQGTALHKLARRGIAVERTPRRIRIDALVLRAAGAAAIAFSVSCSKGTYVRVLAEEIAAAAGTAGHLHTLRRTRFGPFTLADAVPLERIDGQTPLIGVRAALRHLPEIRLDAAAARRARQGYQPLLAELPPGTPDAMAKLITPDGELAAVITTDASGRWQFARVFAGDSREAT